MSCKENSKIFNYFQVSSCRYPRTLKPRKVYESFLGHDFSDLIERVECLEGIIAQFCSASLTLLS
jgi:hypothetical protein